MKDQRAFENDVSFGPFVPYGVGRTTIDLSPSILKNLPVV
jgi:hypothetical protein